MVNGLQLLLIKKNNSNETKTFKIFARLVDKCGSGL